jgi:hypothetical protein
MSTDIAHFCTESYLNSIYWIKIQLDGGGALIPTEIFWSNYQRLVTACLVYVLPNYFSKGQVIYWLSRQNERLES